MIKVIKQIELTNEEKTIFLSLQGLVNKKEAKLYLDVDNYMAYIKDEEYEYTTLQKALKEFRSYYQGAVLFDFIIGDVSINIAASISGIKDYLIIPTTNRNLLKELNLNNYLDITTLQGDDIDKQEAIFEKYKNEFNKDGLIHQVCLKDNFLITLRDYGISHKWFCFYTKEDEKSKSFRKKVLEWANKNIAIFGWTSDEIDFVDDISKYGDYIIPSDWSSNHSFLDKYHEVKLTQKNVKSEILDNKHYLTIVVSDGDNVQWLERDFSTTSSFGQRIKTNEDYIMNWTMAPSMVKSCPKVIEYLYNLGKNNYFVSGVSGAGYMNPCAFPKEYLPYFCQETSSLMKKSDLHVVTLLDNLKNIDKIEEVINIYAKEDNIIGGIYEMDPTKYEGGKGEIFFSDNNKPFASVRVSFWSEDGTNASVSDTWIRNIANKINSFIIDKTSKEGYTVLNVHPWSTTQKDLDKLVSMLSKHIQIIKADDFLNLIKNNVKR